MTKVMQKSGQAIIAKIVPSGATNLTTLEITGENPDGRLFNIARYTVDNTDGNAYLSIMVEKERTIRYLSAMNSWETKTAYGKARKGYKSAKKMNETLAQYGLTLEQVKEMLKAETENAADEIDADEYAVSADAQEIAINAEIENAAANNSAESVTANYQKLNGKYYYNGKEISRDDAIENAVFDILNLNRKTYTENFISEVTEKFENDGYRNGLNCVGIIRARGNAIVADNAAANVEKTKMFKYYLKSNRPICGAVPSGYVNAEKFDNAVRVPRKGYVYGVATYDKPLTAKQIVNYDLRPEDDSEIEKVNTYSANCILINCLDDYFVNSDDAAEVEEINAKNAVDAENVRKEISKTDYKFLVGRIEKIGNGQRDFVQDTQKKAVELLGVEIPQNIFDAANNRNAFNMWLGSEINPIIDNDGYKEEIRVFGDGYDFFEVKANAACLDDYFVNSNDAAMVEIENEINNRLAEDKKRQDFIKSVLNMGDLDGNKEIKLIGKDADGGRTLTARNVAFNGFDYRKMSDGLYHVRIIPQGHETFSTLASYESEGQAQEVIQELGAAIQRGDKTFTFPTIEEINAENAVEENFKMEVTAQNGEVYSLPDGDFALHGNKIFDLLNHELASFDTKKAAENAADELEKAFERGDMTFSFATDAQAEVDVIDVLKATVKAQREKSRKSVIDWNAIYHDIAFAEIFALQDELKKSLKLGEIDRAVNIFDAIKTAYKKTA